MVDHPRVPFFRPDLSGGEVEEVVAALRSGWLTTGPRVRRFEEEFAAAVGGRHAVAVNSCTAALHLAVEALGLKAGDAVLVPTMTFAATAEVVRYLGAVPILVDCDPVTLNIDLADAAAKIEEPRGGDAPGSLTAAEPGGRHHARPRRRPDDGHRRRPVLRPSSTGSGWSKTRPTPSRPPRATGPGAPWRRCGEATADVSCFSFYANKTITTGEGGMAVTDDAALADADAADVASRTVAGRLGDGTPEARAGTTGSSLRATSTT